MCWGSGPYGGVVGEYWGPQGHWHIALLPYRSGGPWQLQTQRTGTKALISSHMAAHDSWSRLRLERQPSLSASAARAVMADRLFCRPWWSASFSHFQIKASLASLGTSSIVFCTMKRSAACISRGMSNWAPIRSSSSASCQPWTSAASRTGYKKRATCLHSSVLTPSMAICSLLLLLSLLLCCASIAPRRTLLIMPMWACTAGMIPFVKRRSTSERRGSNVGTLIEGLDHSIPYMHVTRKIFSSICLQGKVGPRLAVQG
jgi:hypothetical protein